MSFPTGTAPVIEIPTQRISIPPKQFLNTFSNIFYFLHPKILNLRFL